MSGKCAKVAEHVAVQGVEGRSGLGYSGREGIKTNMRKEDDDLDNTLRLKLSEIRRQLEPYHYQITKHMRDLVKMEDDGITEGSRVADAYIRMSVAQSRISQIYADASQTYTDEAEANRARGEALKSRL